MQIPAPTLAPILFVGTVVVVILLAFIFLVVVLHQRRVLTNQAELRTLHAAKQQELFQAVFEGQEAERQRLAADLHDSVGQVLSVIKFNLYRLKKMEAPGTPARALLAETSGLADDCLGEIRHIIRNILPPLLTDFGLVEALQHLAGKVEQATGMQVAFRAEAGFVRPAREVEIMLYRVAQELFSNAIKHSRATVIHVSVAQQPSEVLFTFADNGIGFHPDQVTPGLGLKNLESRVALLRGDIRVGPGPAGGTLTQVRVRAALPDPGP